VFNFIYERVKRGHTIEDVVRATQLLKDAGLGMAVSVGRFEMLENRLLRYIVLGHNLIRGAAGNTILIAELMAREGLL
ncbi:MAG TPA: hypothetical protein EYP08_07060, partial [Pyrodictiaceae archaeon]|nr:hypothetical protein [Pyrodictiaceae archaeon]